VVFLRYELTNYTGGIGQKEVLCNIVDSEWEEMVSCNLNSGIDIVNPFIEVYERRELNVGANLAALCQHISKRFKIETGIFVKNSTRSSDAFAKYAEDVQKYLLLA
jgi:hypothetical protein